MKWLFLLILVVFTSVSKAQELKVETQFPGFLRPGDATELMVKITNPSAKEYTGQVQLELFDDSAGRSIDGWLINSFPNQYFTAEPNQFHIAQFPVQIPFSFDKKIFCRVSVSYGTEKLSLLTRIQVPLDSSSKQMSKSELARGRFIGNNSHIYHVGDTVKYRIAVSSSVGPTATVSHHYPAGFEPLEKQKNLFHQDGSEAMSMDRANLIKGMNYFDISYRVLHQGSFVDKGVSIKNNRHNLSGTTTIVHVE